MVHPVLSTKRDDAHRESLQGGLQGKQNEKERQTQVWHYSGLQVVVENIDQLMTSF